MARPADTPGLPGQATALRIDEGTALGARVAHCLREKPVLWLTTVSPSGRPCPNPVWFLWDGASTVRLFSDARSARVRHLQANPEVSMNLAGGPDGGDVWVLAGSARPRPGDPAADRLPAYVAKYGERMARLGLTPASFAASHGMPIEITLTGLRGPTALPTPAPAALPSDTPGAARP
jgi:PPOX class probable F420-dependent enzyme